VSVTDGVIHQIRELIVKGEIRPGQRLPSEAELGARLGVSRNSLREAVRALCEARVLEIRRGDGTYVSNLEPETLLGGLGFMLDLMHDDTMLEIFEVRRLFEPPATGLAALRATTEDVNELTQSLNRLNEAASDEELVTLDVEFHDRIMRITGNSTLCTLMKALGTRAMRARVWRGILQEGTRNFTFEQHSRIVEAIAAGDPTLAAAASTVHVSASEAWLRRLFEERRATQTAEAEDFNAARLRVMDRHGNGVYNRETQQSGTI
jgi:DNA-binding FadR family transcriptional regulator